MRLLRESLKPLHYQQPGVLEARVLFLLAPSQCSSAVGTKSQPQVPRGSINPAQGAVSLRQALITFKKQKQKKKHKKTN